MRTRAISASLAALLLLAHAPRARAQDDDTSGQSGVTPELSPDDAAIPEATRTKKKKKKAQAAEVPQSSDAPAASPDQPAADAPAAEAPAPATDAPATDVPKSDAPKAETPPAEAPKAAETPAPTPAPSPGIGQRKLPLKGPPPSVFIALESTDPGTRDQVQKVESELRAAFVRDGRMAPAAVPGADAPAAAAPAPNPELQQHLKAAQDAYAGLDLDGAIKEYQEAIKAAFTKPEAADADVIAQTFLAMGASYQLNGDKPHADGAYRFALALRPDLPVDAKIYGPDIRTAVEGQRAELAAKADASPAMIDVEAEGPGSASVTVDGKPAGSTPLRGFKVWPGRHLVVVRAEGFAPRSQVAAAQPGEVAFVKTSLDENPEHKLLADARARATGERNLPAPGPGITELGSQTGAQVVIVGALSSSAEATKIDLAMFDAKGNRRVASITRDAVVESARFPDVADGLALELGNDWVEPPDNPMATDEGPSGKPVFKRWYFWAGVGAVVVAGAAVGYVATQPNPHLPLGVGTAVGIP